MKKTVYKDFILNIMSSAVLTLTLQFLAYPLLGNMYSPKDYGDILLIMAIVNMFGVATGNPLNNTRILLHGKYIANKAKGDFQLIFLTVSLIAFFGSLMVVYIAVKPDFLTLIFASFISVLISFRSYYIAWFRIEINYKKVLVASLFSSIGYILGISLSELTDFWPLTFIIGEIFISAYLLVHSKLVKEKFSKTHLNRLTRKTYMSLFIATSITSAMTYMDRYIIHPLLGSEQVSIFVVASFLGKTAGLVLNPISSVLLTYYARESSISMKTYVKRLSIFLMLTILLYSGIYIFGFEFINFLYPSIAPETKEIFLIANLASTIYILGNVIQPTLIKFANTYWQPIIQGTYISLYIIFGLYSLFNHGLFGFCISLVIVNIIRIIIMNTIMVFTIRNNNNTINKPTSQMEVNNS